MATLHQVVSNIVDQFPSCFQIIRHSEAQYSSSSVHQTIRTIAPWYFSDHQVVRSPVQQYSSPSVYQNHSIPVLFRSSGSQQPSKQVHQTTRTIVPWYFSDHQVVRTSVDQSPSIFRSLDNQRPSTAVHQLIRPPEPQYLSTFQIIRQSETQ